MSGRLPLPDEDSNLDKQNQNLSYCLYTIGQLNEQPAKIGFFENVQKESMNSSRLFHFYEVEVFFAFLNKDIFFMQQ